MQKPVSRPSQGNKRRVRKEHNRSEDKTYLTGVVGDTLPGTRFMVKIERSKGLEPLVIECALKTMFKARNIKIIKGDTVDVEIDPMDPSLRGKIINRH
jgi:translation initiation factor IF-1